MSQSRQCFVRLGGVADDENSSRGTPVTGLPIFAPLSVVETMRTDHAALKERVIKMEGTVESQNARLNDGAESFSEIKHQIETVNKKVNPTWPAVVAVLLTVSGAIWVASRYPDPAKFEGLQDRVQQLQFEQVKVNADLAGIHKALDSIESHNARIEQKLDDALSKGHP